MKLVVKILALGVLALAIIVASEKTTFEKVEDKMKDAKEVINKKVENIKEGVGNVIHETEETIGGWKDMATDKLVEMKEKITGHHEPTFTEKISDKATYIKDWIGTFFEHLMPHKEPETLEEKIAQKYEDFKEAVNKKLSEIKEEASDIIGKKSEDVKDKAQELKDAGKKKMEEAQKDMGKKAGEMKGKVEDVKDDMMKKAGDITNDMLKKAGDIKEKVVDEASELGKAARDKYVEAKDYLFDKHKDMTPYDRISAYIDYIINGVKNLTEPQRSKLVELIYGTEEYQRIKESINYLHAHKKNLTDSQKKDIEKVIKA